MNSLSPDKSLGQHWLDDRASLEAMCAIAELTREDVVLEIGPGLGSLTRRLAHHAGKVVALEFDGRLLEALHRSDLPPQVELRQGDILKFDLTALPKNYKVVANVPYYITSKIVRLLLESANPPGRAVLLVQKEVAERIAAVPGDMSLLAVAVQSYAIAKLGPVVPARLFVPPPQVDSQIISLTRRPQPLFGEMDSADFFRVVKAGFGEKRKKLRNSLSGGLHIGKPASEQLLEAAYIPADARAEQLTVRQWHDLAQVFLQTAGRTV